MKLSPLLDIVTAIFLLLTVAVIAFVALLIANPRSPLNPLPQPTLIAIVVQATDLPTYTPTATFTPGPPTATASATGSPTASFTPLPTATPTASSTPVLALPTLATSLSTTLPNTPRFTQAAVPFTVKSIDYQPNRTSDNYKWSSIAGTVSDIQGVPLKGVAVSVMGGGGTIDETHFSGQESRFGDSGFEVFLGSQPRVDTYTVQLLSKTNSPLSDSVTVRTRADCKQNVVVVNFQQNH